MNTTSLTVSAPARVQTEVVRSNARRLRRRFATRVGYALIAWDRRRDARTTRDLVLQARRTDIARELAERSAQRAAYELARPW